MGLKETVATAALAALKVASELIDSTVVYRDHTSASADDFFSGTFDKDSGGNRDVYTDYPIEHFVLTDFSQRDIQLGIAGPQDQQLIFAQSEMSVTPSPSGTVLVDGVKHVLVGDNTKEGAPVKADPAGATWTLRIRKP